MEEHGLLNNRKKRFKDIDKNHSIRFTDLV